MTHVYTFRVRAAASAAHPFSFRLTQGTRSSDHGQVELNKNNTHLSGNISHLRGSSLVSCIFGTTASRLPSRSWTTALRCEIKALRFVEIRLERHNE